MTLKGFALTLLAVNGVVCLIALGLLAWAANELRRQRIAYLEGRR